MSLLRHKGDKTRIVASVTEVLHDDLCVRGCASRVLLMNYPASEGKEPESCNFPLIPNVTTCGLPEGGAQMEQGDDETRMLFHP